MPEAKVRRLAEHAVNCCNGRVGRNLLELAEKNAEIRRFVIPTGVELVKAAAEAGMFAKDDVNCCNGRVGREPMEELISALGGS